MAAAPSDYKKLRLQKFAPVEERETPEGRFWRKFKLPVVQKLSSMPTCIDFNPVTPHDFAITHGARVSIFDYVSCREKRAISRFKDMAYSATYRRDGKLLVAGCERPLVQVFDTSSRSVLRTFTTHAGPVHVTRFTSDNTHILSASDDRCVKYWDVSASADADALASIPHAHGDYIRCGAVSAATPTLVATGSYDHTVRLWDFRFAGGSGGAGASSSSGSVASGGSSTAGSGDDSDDDDDDGGAAARAAAASGSDVSDDDSSGDSDDDDEEEEEDDAMRRVLEADGEDDDSDDDGDSEDDDVDLRGSSAGGALRRSTASSTAASSLPRGCVMSVDHGEPVTQVLLLPGGSSFLTSGGQTVKVWDAVGGGRLLQSFSHHQKLVTSMCFDGSGTRLLTGALDGQVKVHELATYSVTHSMKYDAGVVALAISGDNTRLAVGTVDATLHVKQRLVKVADLLSERKDARLLRGGTYRYFLRGQSTVASHEDVVASTAVGAKPKLRAYDRHLKAFEYASALDAALATADPVTVVTVVQELIARDGLQASLAGRTDDALAPVLAFLIRHLSDPRYASLLLDVANLVVDMYAPLLGSSTTVDTLFLRLHAAIAREVGLGRDLLGLQGALDLLMAASTTGEGPATASSSSSSSSSAAAGGGVVGGAGTGSGYDTAYTYGYVADE